MQLLRSSPEILRNYIIDDKQKCSFTNQSLDSFYRVEKAIIQIEQAINGKPLSVMH